MSVPTPTEIIEQYAQDHPLRQEALLGLLHRVQDALGHLSEGALIELANALNLSAAEIYGVASFYDDFRFEPQVPLIQVCNGEACQARGSRALLMAAADQGIAYRVREVFCLGNCAVGPNVRVRDRVIGGVDNERLRALAATDAGPGG